MFGLSFDFDIVRYNISFAYQISRLTMHLSETGHRKQMVFPLVPAIKWQHGSALRRLGWTLADTNTIIHCQDPSVSSWVTEDSDPTD